MPVLARRLLPSLFCSVLLLSGCSGDENTSDENGQPTASDTPVIQGPVGASDNGRFALTSATETVTVLEGGDAVAIDLNLTRRAGFDGAVTLAAGTPVAADGAALSWSFSDERLSANESASRLQVTLAIGARPLQPEQRALRISATDGSGTPVELDLTLQVQPTAAPDIYLLIGQSNMVGFSLSDARQALPGEPDAPDPRIRQLNPTGNDPGNFVDPIDFTDDSIVADPTLTIALDPLHDGFNPATDSKGGQFIGAGLSFAKAALDDTTADIVLVPAAWSDTGFCARSTNLLPGVGWLPRPLADPAFAGTLLHDRAIARANLAIEQSGGVLRGLLWHQGEADVGDPTCAAAYADNLAAMVASLRTNIDADARGPAARGAAADIPFVVGTMSMGSDARGSQVPFGAAKQQVDAAHRNVALAIPSSAVVNNDDLVPPAFPCGQSSCIHFGAAALREMGARYYDQLRQVITTP